ncbi:MAG: stage II sporulation protein D [Clostridia bacterium]|nr:stage II sporulation protein D [Clostridia bacterium]
MRRAVLIVVFLAAVMLGVPLGTFALGSSRAERSEPPESTTGPEEPGDAITVFLAEENRVEEIDLTDYLVGVLAAEMPVSAPPEALKAQAAVSLTLARYMQKGGAKADLAGAVISSDPGRHQGYFTEETRKARFGADFEEIEEKLRAAAEAVRGVTIVYEGEPILAAFHAISAGMTEDASNVWGGGYPYLSSVDSSWDRADPGFESGAVLSPEAFFGALGLPVPDDPAAAVTDAVYSDAGYLLSVAVSGEAFTGREIRQKLSLRSSAAEIKWEDGAFHLTVRGYGHGVGMSQAGAMALAERGCLWKDIVLHYYPGASIDGAGA